MKLFVNITVCLALSGLCLTAHAQNANDAVVITVDLSVFAPVSSAAAEPADEQAAEQIDELPAESVSEPVAAETAVTETVVAPAESLTPVDDPMTVNAARSRRGLVSTNNVFVPQGQWIFGGYASYSTHSNDNYTFVVFENINSDGYTFKVSPMISYALRDNMALGLRFIYGRTLLRVDGGELNLGDEDSGTHITADYYYSLKHSYSVAAIWRQYIPLGRNKRFALFNEMSLAVGGHQAKFAADTPLRGTYETGYEVSLGVSPGLIAFATNTLAVEINVGVMGISYNRTHQIQNQVETADVQSSFMNFKINLLSIGLGVSFYL